MIGGDINRLGSIPCDCCRRVSQRCMGVTVQPRCTGVWLLPSDIDKTAMELSDWSVQHLPRKFARGSTLSISLTRRDSGRRKFR